MTAFLRLAASAGCGAVFGLGLSVSGMLDPERVRGFLDVAGAWDPSLSFVLAGAVITSFTGVQIANRMRAPLLGGSFDLPSKTRLDMPLLSGAALFGIGWGLAGLCPGPAIASLSMGLVQTTVFVVAMLIGFLLFAGFDAVRRGTDQSEAIIPPPLPR